MAGKELVSQDILRLLHWKLSISRFFSPKNSQTDGERGQGREEVVDQKWLPVELYMAVFLRFICETSIVTDVWIFIYIVRSLFDLMLKYILSLG